MSQTTHYTQVFIAILAMIILVMLPLRFSNHSFTPYMLFKVLAYGIVVLWIVVMLYEALLG